MTDEPMTRPVVPGELVELVAQERRRCAAIARSVDLFEGDRLKNSDPRETIAAAIESTDRQGAGEVQYEAGRRAGIEAAAKVADSPGFIEARDTDWDAGVNYAKRYIATAIRALRPEHLVARAAMHGEAGLDMSAEQSAKRGRGESC